MEIDPFKPPGEKPLPDSLDGCLKEIAALVTEKAAATLKLAHLGDRKRCIEDSEAEFHRVRNVADARVKEVVYRAEMIQREGMTEAESE